MPRRPTFLKIILDHSGFQPPLPGHLLDHPGFGRRVRDRFFFFSGPRILETRPQNDLTDDPVTNPEPPGKKLSKQKKKNAKTEKHKQHRHLHPRAAPHLGRTNTGGLKGEWPTAIDPAFVLRGKRTASAWFVSCQHQTDCAHDLAGSGFHDRFLARFGGKRCLCRGQLPHQYE